MATTLQLKRLLSKELGLVSPEDLGPLRQRAEEGAKALFAVVKEVDRLLGTLAPKQASVKKAARAREKKAAPKNVKKRSQARSVKKKFSKQALAAHRNVSKRMKSYREQYDKGKGRMRPGVLAVMTGRGGPKKTDILAAAERGSFQVTAKGILVSKYKPWAMKWRMGKAAK